MTATAVHFTLAISLLVIAPSSWGQDAGGVLGQQLRTRDFGVIADEAADKLGALYAPASTRFVLARVSNSACGLALVRRLRDKGFAVRESEVGDSMKVNTEANDAAIPLTCFIEPFGDGVRLGLRLGDGWSALDRVYQHLSGTWQALGPWTQRR